MKKLIILIATTFAMSSLIAKETFPQVEVTTRLESDNSLSFIAKITGYGVFTVELIFENNKNTTVEERVITSVKNDGVFYSLKPIDSSIAVEIDYYYNWLQGELNPTINADHIYNLPFDSGLTVTPKFLSRADVKQYRSNSRNFAVWCFPLNKDTYIYPIREGMVTMVEGFKSSPNSKSSYDDLARYNEIYVTHNDGTIANYSVLNTNSLMIKEGDKVFTDTPIAKAGEITADNYGVYVALYYYVTNNSQYHPNAMSQKVYINPVFTTADGDTQLENEKAVTKASKESVKTEKPVKRSFWKRLFGRR